MSLTNPSPRRLIASVAAVASIAAVAAPVSSSAAGTARVASTPRCASSGLVAWIDTNGNGTAGSTFYQLKFTNLSGHRCTLRGYPGVSGVNLSGHRLGRAASRDHGDPSHLISLGNGATATATLRIVDTGVFGTGCRPVIAAGLRVYPPNQATAKFVPFPFSACSHSGPGYLSVRAVRH